MCSLSNNNLLQCHLFINAMTCIIESTDHSERSDHVPCRYQLLEIQRQVRTDPLCVTHRAAEMTSIFIANLHIQGLWYTWR